MLKISSEERLQQARKKWVCCLTNKTEQDYLVCLSCRIKNSENGKKRKQKAIDNGFCCICTRKPAVPPLKMCDNCAKKQREHARKWHKNKKLKARELNLCVKCAKNKPTMGKLCDHCRSLRIKSARARRLRLKLEVFKAYGGPHCACCGQSILGFLTLDHINNDGAAHRKKVPGTELYEWVKDNNFPPGFRVLCYDCNIGRSKTEGNICPHKMIGDTYSLAEYAEMVETGYVSHPDGPSRMYSIDSPLPKLKGGWPTPKIK